MWYRLVIIIFAFSAIIFYNSDCKYNKDAVDNKSFRSSNDLVVIFHGILRPSSHMRPVANRLNAEGYQVLNVNYPSTKYPIEKLVEIIYKNNLSNIDKERRVHFIGYSMGGLVIRAILNSHKFPNLGNVLFLATPHYGSEVADFLQDNYLFKKLFGPAGLQLTTTYDLSKLLGDPYYDFAVIAGNSSIDPFSSYLIPGEDDGKVSLKSAIFEGATDSVIINSSHSFFPSNHQVLDQIVYFMSNKSFGDE